MELDYLKLAVLAQFFIITRQNTLNCIDIEIASPLIYRNPKGEEEKYLKCTCRIKMMENTELVSTDQNT